MAIQTRRHKPRVLLNENVSLTFLSGAHATIVDISETGLRFKTSSPLTHGESSKFRFAFNGGGELTAILAWTDTFHTTGGLRFESLPPQVRQQTRAWIENSWETTRRPRSVVGSIATTATMSQPVATSSNGAVFTEIQSPTKTKQRPTAMKFDNGLLVKQTGMENRLSMFAGGAATATDHAVVSAHKPARGHWLAAATLVVLILLVAATAAAEFFDPTGARHVLTRAGNIAVQVTSRTRKLLTPKLNPQRLGGAPSQSGN